MQSVDEGHGTRAGLSCLCMADCGGMKSDETASEFVNANRKRVVLKDPNGKILPDILPDGTPVEVYLVHWVDDLLVMSNSDVHRLALIERIKRRYRLEDMGLAKWFLGMELVQTDGCIELLQTAYIERFCKDLLVSQRKTKQLLQRPGPEYQVVGEGHPRIRGGARKLQKKFPMREAWENSFIYAYKT